jgi:HTH DNA binding domain
MGPVGTARRPSSAKPGPVGSGSARAGKPLLEIRFNSRPDGHPLAQLFERDGVEAKLIACRVTDREPRRLVRWLDLEAEPAQMEALLPSIRSLVSSRNLAVAHLGPGRVLLRIDEPAPAICAATYEAGGICITCPLLAPKEQGPWRVVLAGGSRTRAFLRDLPREPFARASITHVEPYRSRTTLTQHQDRTLRVAYDLGYFAYPRRATLGEVARTLGKGRSATLETLRRATAKLAGIRYGQELGVRVVAELQPKASRRGQ